MSLTDDVKINIDDIVIIEWVDTMAWAGWQSQEQLKEYSLLPITSVGIVVADKEDCILIATSVAGNTLHEQVGQITSIPKCSITKITKV
jgi:hypothetical protein